MELISPIMAVFVVGLFAAIAYGAFQHHKKRIAAIQDGSSFL